MDCMYGADAVRNASTATAESAFNVHQARGRRKSREGLKVSKTKEAKKSPDRG